MNIDHGLPNCQVTLPPPSVISFLTQKLRRPEFFLTLYSDGSMKKCPNATMGNKVYAWIRETRIAEAVKYLLSLAGSCLWITLTQRNDQKTDAARRESWKVAQSKLPAYLRRLKKLGFDTYITVKEAHYKGGCHVHILARTPQVLRFYTLKKKLRLTDCDLRTALKAAWHNDWHVDIQGVRDEKIGAYLVKEMGKQSHIETALKRAKKGEAKKSDVKKLWAIYYASELKIRMVSMSRNIPVQADPEGEKPDADLIRDMNNTTEKKIVAVFVIPWHIKNSPDFEPYTGIVMPKSREWILFTEWIKDRVPDPI